MPKIREMTVAETACAKTQTVDDGRWTMDDGRWTMDDVYFSSVLYIKHIIFYKRKSRKLHAQLA